MTSRRELLGLLAAAPLVAPAIAKEMASAMAMPKYAIGGYVSGISGELTVAEMLTPCPNFASSIDRYPHELITRGFDSGQAVYRDAIERGETAIESSRQAAIHAIPNRLYGAQVNADGDAI